MAKTGYKIITYIDVNPMSPTFQTTRTERVADADCDAESANWQEVSRYCELDESLQNTGYEILTEMDVNIDSPTYGQTRETRSMNLLRCPLKSTDPNWVIDTEESYCETKVFPSGLEGNTGIYVLSMTDENDASETFNQTITSSITESDWTEELEEEFGEYPCEAVDTEPKIEVITSNCVLEVGEDGQLHTNGYEEVTGIDRNPYSMSYLSAVTIVRENEERCPSKQTVITVNAESDKYLIEGESATTFTIHYWATVDGVITLDNLTLETVPLDEGESAFTYTQTSSGNDGRLYKTFSAQANDVNIQKVAKFKAKYNDLYSEVIVIKQSGVDQKVLPDFDYLTFTFNWTNEDGKDLDTATFVLGSHLPIVDKTLDEVPVGYGCWGVRPTYSAATSQYLQHGGDNTQSGNECALVNWKTICDHDYITEGITTLYCELYGNWYNEYQNGNCSITFKTYKGDGMQHGTEGNPFIFVPTGNTQLVSEMTVSGHVQAFSTTNASARYQSPSGDEKGYYSHVATLEYDIKSKSAFFTNRMTTPSGRNLRSYGTVDGTAIVGGNSENLGKAEFNYTASAQSGSLSFSNFYNIANGLRSDATAYEVEIKYYALDGHQLQEGYATATISNGVLSWTLEANPTGERREADFIIKGIQSIRNIIYRIECKQS